MKTRKLFSFLVVLILLFGGFIFKPAPAKAIHLFKVTISDHTPGAVPTYRFQFTIEKKLEVHQNISLIFPSGTTYKDPKIIDPIKSSNANIETLEDGSVKLKFNTYITLDPAIEGYDNIVVTIPPESGYEITNPKIPGSYTYKIATQAEEEYVTSYPVEIFQSAITSPEMDIEPNRASQLAGFSFDFKSSHFGELNPRYNDYIRIRFPEEFTLKSQTLFGGKSWIMVNDSFMTQPPIMEGNDLIIYVPEKIVRGRSISVKVDSRCGIINPSQPGSYRLLISTSTDAEWVQTTTVIIK